ncbi:MAG TPA: NAD(P)(+) transhydrogenase (Re/Si-specific) subunit beta [Rubrobacteraceae bacterium]|nr:NAD(P)(+) transhydrogenase (Re/Si-specific) subunit beta [Rubrobacteraceae bacterium]
MGVPTAIAYLIAALLFIVGIRRLRSPDTARSGNTISALGMIIAVVATLLSAEIVNFWEIMAAIAVGAVIGAVSAQRVQMTAMPQMVAAFNGVGGGAAALVAIIEFYRFQELGAESEGGFITTTILLGVLIGSVSFAGSTIAFSKLQELFLSGSVRFPLQTVVNAVIFGAVVILGINVVAGGPAPLLSVGLIFALSLTLGVLLVIPIGGADMPIVISLLNAFTGLAAAMSGFALSNDVLIISGSLVGASGTILTRLMSSSLGRPLGKIIFGAVGAAPDKKGDEEEKPVRSVGADDVAALLKYDADKIIFVPGYGLAVAQAQNLMSELSNVLEGQGKDVKFAIHPVAGRMPGHMNVLLAEADISYDKLYDMEDINAEFPDTDAVVIVGANDVVNPAAKDPEVDSPISGMPVLNVDEARQVVFVKRSLSPGFAGVDNPLFYDEEKTMMLFADAKQGLQDIISGVKSM